MTQAYNLSQLANNLNSTGQLDATDGLVNAVPATNGGTGQAAYAIGDLLYAPTTTTLNKLADVATGNALLSGGVGVAPAYGKVGLTTHVSGTLGAANGGTGAATLASNNVLLGNGVGALQTVAPGTAGNALISDGTTWVSGAASTVIQTRTLTAGTTYTTPVGVKAIRVFVGGATGGQNGGSTIATGGVGGAGYSEKYIVTPASTYTYSVGAAGAIGAAGGTTTFSTISVTGSGGVSSGTGSAGGAASGGDFNASGGAGGNQGSNNGGGGGGAGTRAGAGGIGGTGVSILGGGGGGTGGLNGSGGTPGAAATTLSATAISGWDISAPFTFSGGNVGSGPACGFGGVGGIGASNTEITGYVKAMPSATFSYGGQGVGYSIQRVGFAGQIVVWEYI